MKTKLLFFCFSLLISSISFSQNRFTDTSVTCIAFWKNKETRVYQIKHSKEKFDALNLKSSWEGNFEAHVKIIDSTASGFTIEWVYKNFKVTGTPEYVLNSLSAIMEGLKIIYKADEAGMFTELINWEEVRDFSISNYEKALAKNTQTKEFIGALSQIKSIFQSKENTEALLIKEIQLFHTPYGIEYTKNGNIIETELPNITGGSPFPATINMKLDKLDLQNDLTIVTLNQTIDKDKASAITADLISQPSKSPHALASIN